MIAVLLSGGVDSSVSLCELQKSGYSDIMAFYIKVWLEGDGALLGDCPWQEDLSYARSVCKRRGVPLEVMSLQREYNERVVGYTIDELRSGRTPSPDLLCNEKIKFGLALERIGPSADLVASGHYAIIERRENAPVRLLRAVDPIKDQTYFLARLTQAQLRRLSFPIGGYEKRRVRELACPIWAVDYESSRQSRICFLGTIRYRDFVRRYLGVSRGEIVERESGKILGEHNGYWFYTIGQRSGLGLGNGPWYVSGKDTRENIVYVSHSNAQRAYGGLAARDLHWIEGAAPSEKTLSQGLSVKLRHGPELIKCSARFVEYDKLSVTLQRPDQGIAPGQFAVFYADRICLGSGAIA